MLEGAGPGLGLPVPRERASALPTALASGNPCALRVPHLRAVGFPGEGSEDAAKHPALLGILHLVAVEVVELGASAAEHQGHGGGLQPCKQHCGLGEPAPSGAALATPPIGSFRLAYSPHLSGIWPLGQCGTHFSKTLLSPIPSSLEGVPFLGWNGPEQWWR